MSGAINYRFPDFRLADQSKNTFAKHFTVIRRKREKLSDKSSFRELSVQGIIVMYYAMNISEIIATVSRYTTVIESIRFIIQ